MTWALLGWRETLNKKRPERDFVQVFLIDWLRGKDLNL